VNPFEDTGYSAARAMTAAALRPSAEPAPALLPLPRRDAGGAMELHDVGRRIVGRYWWLIALLVVAGAAVAALSRSGEKTYTASARIVLDTPDPSTRVESAAIADTVKAIATSQSQVRAALQMAHARRDALDVAEHHVSVSGLGSSSVVKVSVSDRDRHVATNVANALAARVITTRSQVSSGGVPQELTALTKRIDQLSVRIAGADAAIDQLNVAVANAATPERANDLRARRDTASRRRDFLAQQRNVLESERVSILGTAALRPKPSIISRASVPLHADSSGRWPYMILGALLGLVLGVGLAALIETVRPTVVGGDALARELDTPLLGTLRGRVDDEESDEGLVPVAARVRLAAEAAGVDDVALFPVKADVDVRGLVERLEAGPGKGLGVLPAEAGAHHRSSARILAFDLGSPATVDERRTRGLVLISPNVIKKTDLVDVGHLLRVTPMPLLGLITYRPARLLGRGRGRAGAPVLGAGSTSTS
jgi:capsular polysaccharide biosynthesis protein